MAKTGFLLALIVLVLLLPASGVTLSANSPNNNITDQVALLALKSHVTNDPQNILASGWSAAVSVCNWTGVSCGTTKNRVTSLILSGMGLTGTIPPHLGNLSFLSTLDIQNNSFQGSLPIELAHLRRLEYLDFSSNIIGGEIINFFSTITTENI